MKSLAFLVSMLTLASLAACGGGGSPPAMYSIGGTVTGLSGTGLVLQNNGGNNLAVTANGIFTFTAQVSSGAAYAVTVLAQPSNPAQSCVVTSGSGHASSNITSVLVTCTTVPVHNQWAWMNGSNLASQKGIYGTEGAAAAINVPGGRLGAVSWMDAAGNFWLFGGFGVDSAGTANLMNDLWKYSAGQWTWISGANVVNQIGTYGTKGVAAPTNIPGARQDAVSWTDAAGNLWLFGGFGFDSAGTINPLNDLWEYSAGQWTWVGGSTLASQFGAYGTKGTAAPGNVPGARYYMFAWTDVAGDFWLFGGQGLDSIGADGYFNDLWKYSSGEWTWVSGADVIDQTGNYGVMGTPSASNILGGRQSPTGWTDAAGNFWSFAGYGIDSTGGVGNLNDLWRYSAGDWTWMDGPNVANQPGVYGTLGNSAPGNVPSSRDGAASWADSGGNFWLFGGFAFQFSEPESYPYLNDLWKYSAGQWTWMGGSSLYAQSGVYGTQTMPAPGNIPGARSLPVTWVDASGNVWLFGGIGYDSTGAFGPLNDLWKYEP